MNKVILIGRLARDPEVRYSQTGNEQMAIARYTLAVDRAHKKDGGQSADFISCVAFGKNGEFAEKFLHKGMKIAVCGHWQTGSYENQEGKKVYTNDCVVESHDFCEKKSESGQTQEQPQTDADGFMSIPDGIADELPFG
jgi:single-strand DNA-binding protein